MRIMTVFPKPKRITPFKNNLFQRVSSTEAKEIIKSPNKKNMLLALAFQFLFFLSGFSFTTIHESQACRRRGKALL